MTCDCHLTSEYSNFAVPGLRLAVCVWHLVIYLMLLLMDGV